MTTRADKFTIRLARMEEVGTLREIEDAAGKLFDGLDLVDEDNDPGISPERIAALIELGQAWVIYNLEDKRVGMALASELEGDLYLEEIDVLPEYGRQGLGACLLEHVCDWALSRGFRTVTLSTFRDVAWNGPFYRKHGFIDVSETEWTAYMRDLRKKETENGLRVDKRVFMRRTLSPPAAGGPHHSVV